MEDAVRNKIAAMTDLKVATPAAPKEDTVWDRVSREAYVVGGGLSDGFTSHLNSKSLVEKSPELLLSFGLGAGLAAAQGKGGMVKLGAQAIGLAFGVGMVKDLSSPERINGLTTAVSNTWNSPTQLDYNRALVKQHAGDFAFDTVLMSAGGIAGAGSVKIGRSEAAQNLRSLMSDGVSNLKTSTRALFTNSELRAATAKSDVHGFSTGMVEKPTAALGAVTESTTPGLFKSTSRPFGNMSESTGVSFERSTGSLSKDLAKAGTNQSAKLREEGSASLQKPHMEPDGRHLPAFDVYPEGPLTANKFSSRVETDGQGKPTIDVKKTDVVDWEIQPGKTWQWHPNEQGTEVRLQAQSFVDKFMKGDYAGALNVAVEAPVMERINLNPASRVHEVRINAADLAKPEIVEIKMNELSKYAEFKWSQVVADGVPGDSRLEVVIPKTIVELKSGADVRLVDIVPTQSSGYRQSYKMEFPTHDIKGKPLSAEQTKEIQALRESPGGQRVLAETAIFGFEETIVHANQHITQGGGISSPAFAEFARNIAASNENLRGHRLSLLGSLTAKHAERPKIMEQEVPALAYDAGMPLSMVRHHFFFGSRHVEQRTPVMNFLKFREMFGPKPEHSFVPKDD